MSDRVTNVDIDDVLSSIRRLVSDGGPNSPVKSAVSEQVDAQAERLVLTPNFRVKETATSIDTPTQAANNDPDPLQLSSLARVDAEDIGETALVLQPEQSIPADQNVTNISRETLEATIAELEAQVGDKNEEWEPDGSEVAEEVTWESAGFVAGKREVAPDVEAISETATHPEPSLAEALEDSVVSAVVMEAFQREMEMEPEPDDASVIPEGDAQAFVANPRPHRWSDKTEGRLTPTTDDSFGDDLVVAADDQTDEMLEKYLSKTPMFDEEVLKRVVHEVVREELQGNLGERITRNVRKLVRREIHNILTTQEFD